MKKLTFSPHHLSDVNKEPQRNKYSTFSLTRIAEHCRVTPSSLCGFHVTERALKQGKTSY